MDMHHEHEHTSEVLHQHPTEHDGNSGQSHRVKHEEQHGHGTHVNHSGHEQMFRRRFWVSLVLTLPVLLFSPMI